MRKIVLVCVIAIGFLTINIFSIPAFPGAEGYGVNEITGGRGGEIRIVKNLNDMGPGSFREAVAGDKPKIVVFKVSGIIRTKGGVSIGSNTTIAGQTSPAGITFYNWRYDGNPQNNKIIPTAGNSVVVIGNYNQGGDGNVIIRHIRVRGAAYKEDPFYGFASNIILDHCSFSWGGDQEVTFWNNTRNITIQWCTIEESVAFWHGEGTHNYGHMIGSDPSAIPSGNYSIHHTLMAHHVKRGPELQIGPDLAADVRNCVWYNMEVGTDIICNEDEGGD